MQKKSPKLGFIICTLALLSVLFFCFPASAETFEVGPELSLSQALDDAVDGDIINVYDNSGLLNSITKNITINIASEKNLSISTPDISISNATINGRVVVGGQTTHLTVGENAIINGNLIISNQGTATIDGGSIIATEPNPYAIYVDSSTLNVENGTISTGQGKTCIYVRNNSELNFNGGTITAIGELATGIYISDSSLNIAGGTIYGQYRAINSSNSAITAVSPAKIKSANMNPVNSTGGNVDIAPGCIYNNPSTKDKVSLKLDITTSDTITFTIDDIGVKDKFYIDIPSDINVLNNFIFYIDEDEDNALTDVCIKSMNIYGSSSIINNIRGSFTSITGVIVFNLNITMFYNDAFEEKEIEVVLLQKDVKLLEFRPNVVTSEWRDNHITFSNSQFSIDVYAGSTNAILSLPDSANNMIKAFEILEDGTTVAFENLGENEYKIDLSSVSTQPRINIKVKYADDSTNELLLYINKRAVRVSCSHTQEGIFDVIASYVSHESFTPENPHLLVVYKNGTIFGNEKIIDIKTFDISQYTPNEKGVYEILIEGYQNVYDTSSNTANCADVYLISGDIKPDDEVFSGMVLMDPWRSIWSNFEF